MFDLNPISILLKLPGILIGLSFHEFAHALVSDRLGDPTPRAQGRLTLSPIPHIDIFGFILLMFAGFGWAKPVQINTRYYKHPKRDEIMVSLAGPIMNILLAFVFAFFLKLFTSYSLNSSISQNLFGIIAGLIIYTVRINIGLFIFNLLPLPPLDGFHVLANIIPARNYEIIYKIQQYSTIIFLIIVITPVVSYIINPPYTFIYQNIMNLFGLGMYGF